MKDFSMYGKINYIYWKNLLYSYNRIKDFSMYGKNKLHILKNLFNGYNY